MNVLGNVLFMPDTTVLLDSDWLEILTFFFPIKQTFFLGYRKISIQMLCVNRIKHVVYGRSLQSQSEVKVCVPGSGRFAVSL